MADSKAAQMLARKRARDRRAQQAMRDRAKGTVESLRDQLELSERRLIAQEATFARELARYADKNEQLRAKIENLREESAGSFPLLFSHQWQHSTAVPKRLSLDSATLAEWGASPLVSNLLTAGLPSPGSSAGNPRRIVKHGRRLQQQPSPSEDLTQNRHDHPIQVQIPLHMSPTCPTDRIILPFIWEMRSLFHDQDWGTSSVSSLSAVDTRNASRPWATSSMGVKASTSRVAADILATYPDIDTVTKKVACLYTITSVVNWLIMGTEESFQEMPSWMRPTQIQLEIPHPAWIDRVAWPSVRDSLIQNHQEITFDQYTDALTSSLCLNWPYGDDTVILEGFGPDADSKSWSVNPVFEKHIRDLGNWTVGPRYGHILPGLGEEVEKDRKTYGGQP